MQEKRKTSHRERGTGRISFIARHAFVENHCDGEIVLKTAMSATVQLPRAERYRLTHFAGDSCAECYIIKRPSQGRPYRISDDSAAVAPFIPLYYLSPTHRSPNGKIPRFLCCRVSTPSRASRRFRQARLSLPHADPHSRSGSRARYAHLS